MTTYTAILGVETDPGKPVKSDLMKRLTDNPIAITEGADGAPRVLGKALGSTFIGGATLSGTTPQGFINLAGMETIKVDYVASNWGTGAALQVRFSDDNGGSHGTYQTLVSQASGGSIESAGSLYLNLRTGAQFSMGSVNIATAVMTNSTALTVPANCNAFQIRINSGGSFSAGIIAFCLGGLQ